MGRLKTIPSRLSGVKPRLAQPSPRETEGQRRSEGPIKSYRWQKLRQKILARDGYVCRQTGVALIGKYPEANSPVVDHIKPHRGDLDLFWDESNLQSVTKAWHDREKQSLEKRGLA